MRKPLFVALSGLWLIGCGGGESGPDAAPPAPACSLNSLDSEPTPGFPFRPADFDNTIWPALITGCGNGTGCHAPGNATKFTVYPKEGDTAERCNYINSFNSFYDNSDFKVSVSNSPVLAKINKATAGTHPIQLEVTDANYTLYQNYIQAAFDNYKANVGGTDPSTYFDKDTYFSDVQPALENGSCLDVCHSKATSLGGFGLVAGAAAGTPDGEANFQAVVARVSLNLLATQGNQSNLYIYATNTHSGKPLPSDEADKVLAWVNAALAAKPPTGGGGGGGAGSADVEKFNIGVFRDEILPILTGDVDYNDIEGGRTTTGCIRGPCHGQPRGAGKFFVNPLGTPEEILANFVQFTDLFNPVGSQVLACPLNLSRCVAPGGHPGQDVFEGVEDRNYGKILSFIYSAKNVTTPLDFAFFARQINPIFDDLESVQNGALGITCADFACHGAPRPGEPPGNGSNFPILPESGNNRDRLLLNFASAANFTFFPDPAQSSLFLYPTDEVADTDNNDLATGIPHPGGADFAVDSPQALAILKFAGGLRPDNQGFLRDFLVAGDFDVSDINDSPLINEDQLTFTPEIFDNSGAGTQFNAGLWDGFFSANAVVDLNDAEQGFPSAPANRIAYAAAYVINTTSRPLDVRIVVASPNDVEIFAGTQSNLGRDGAGTNVQVTLPPYNVDNQTITRILLKVFQSADDVDFNFTMKFEDDNGNPLTDISKELVFKLSPVGGI